MPFNMINFKKSMLGWEAVSKTAPEQIKTVVAKMAGTQHPEAIAVGAELAAHVKSSNQRLHDLLDKVVTAKDDNSRSGAAHNALANAKQYQSYLASSHIPPEILTKLNPALADLIQKLG